MDGPSVFSSYAHDDERWARAIADALRDWAVSVWCAADELPAGEPWNDALRAALESASTVPVIVPPAHAASSRWAQLELGAAVAAAQEGKRVIPVYSSKRGEEHLPLLGDWQGIGVAGLRPEQAGGESGTW